VPGTTIRGGGLSLHPFVEKIPGRKKRLSRMTAGVGGSGPARSVPDEEQKIFDLLKIASILCGLWPITFIYPFQYERPKT